jgi:hypothetical protein
VSNIQIVLSLINPSQHASGAREDNHGATLAAGSESPNPLAPEDQQVHTPEEDPFGMTSTRTFPSSTVKLHAPAQKAKCESCSAFKDSTVDPRGLDCDICFFIERARLQLNGESSDHPYYKDNSSFALRLCSILRYGSSTSCIDLDM